MVDLGDTPSQQTQSIVVILNRAMPLFLAGLAVSVAFRMGLFNIGVEGQYRMATILAAAAGAAVALPAPLHIAADRRRGDARRRAVGRHRRRPQGDPRRQRGHQLDHAQLRRARAGVVPAQRPVPGQPRGCPDHHDDAAARVGLVPRPQRAVHRAGSRRAAHRAVRVPAGRDRGRRRDRRPAQAHPLRLRPAGHGALAVGGHRQRRRRPRHGGQDDADLRCRRRADRAARPARRHPLLRHRVHRRARASSASPSRCWAATARSASRSRRCCSRSSTGPRCRCSSPTSPRRWSRSSRARSCSPSSSPTRSPAGWRCARPSARAPGRCRRPPDGGGGGGGPDTARTTARDGSGRRSDERQGAQA